MVYNFELSTALFIPQCGVGTCLLKNKTFLSNKINYLEKRFFLWHDGCIINWQDRKTVETLKRSLAICLFYSLC